MPTQLTSPVVDTVTTVTIEKWEMVLRYNPDFSLDMTASHFEIIVADRRVDGSLKQNRNLVLSVDAMTNGQKTVLRNFHAQVVTLARTAGLIPAGTDSNDI